MLLMQGKVAFAAHALDRPESADVCNELKNGINAGSNISDFPALSRMKTTVRKRCEGSNARTWSAAVSPCSGASVSIAPGNKSSGTRPSAIVRPVLTLLPFRPAVPQLYNFARLRYTLGNERNANRVGSPVCGLSGRPAERERHGAR
jgi:hypothetical protein